MARNHKRRRRSSEFRTRQRRRIDDNAPAIKTKAGGGSKLALGLIFKTFGLAAYTVAVLLAGGNGPKAEDSKSVADPSIRPGVLTVSEVPAEIDSLIRIYEEAEEDEIVYFDRARGIAGTVPADDLAVEFFEGAETYKEIGFP